MPETHSSLIGAHVSIAGGFAKAIERGITIGANTIQIFTKSNRQWKASPIQENDALDFITAQKKSSIEIVVAHAAYLINLGSDSAATQETSLKSLIEEIQRCDILHIPYLVLHPGSGTKDATDVCLQIASLLEKALHATENCKVMILLETMAGQGDTIGAQFENLAFIRNHVALKSRIGFCIDTCHIFAAGHAFDTQESYKSLMHEIDSTLGLSHIKLFHINDSKKELGSNVDRHEHIGEGKIPLTAFSFLLRDPRFIHIPKILETPKDKDKETEDDIRNIKKLKSLLKNNEVRLSLRYLR